ncbi:TrmB family transcriptional regulator [Legionella maceachernii]|uniref:Sugar-specific transcriptional regulator TrmB n=1 Tax=Legionella maceachernii TaxID=466 RepID=A0A0W0VVV6_9GAMM|nr:helix-turn-helix domain-containing protein [Legionella maceachernii]KTD24436.1 Sugar-specific transcriptional regulator TrmB [Legionella maceachernii]SJZ66866.1 Sugar-specific transcriptional regulator TrmB [Legionella maceachernii]SUP01995.1 Sugar-specific transcriptional regulator TrmB [Legionella maceachernii]
MNNQVLPGLISLGLSEKEALLYMAALRMGPTTAQNLSLESGLKRATVYGLIETLITKGLMHVEIKGVRKLYVAESPEKLALLLENQKQTLNAIMPALVQDYLRCSPTVNTIKTYQGLSGIKLLYDNILITLKRGDEYLVISDQDKWYELDPEYFKEFMQKRSLLVPNIKLILQDNNKSHSHYCTQSKIVCENSIKLLPAHMRLNINMVIYGHYVILVQIVEPFLAIFIENPHVAEMHRSLFNTIWELV